MFEKELTRRDLFVEAGKATIALLTFSFFKVEKAKAQIPTGNEALDKLLRELVDLYQSAMTLANPEFGEEDPTLDPNWQNKLGQIYEYAVKFGEVAIKAKKIDPGILDQFMSLPDVSAIIDDFASNDAAKPPREGLSPEEKAREMEIKYKQMEEMLEKVYAMHKKLGDEKTEPMVRWYEGLVCGYYPHLCRPLF